MGSKLIQTTAVAAILSSGGAAADGDPALIGCWRPQQVQVTKADKALVQQNVDCVSDFDATHYRSRCATGSRMKNSLARYEVTAPGKMLVTALDVDSGKPLGAPAQVSYRIDQNWLMNERPVDSAPAQANTSKAISLTSVSIRVPVDDARKARCEPRGDLGLRIGMTWRSSLTLRVPAGWTPKLVDPGSDKELRDAIGTSFFVGGFVPRSPQAAGKMRVLILDDTRYGPAPVRAAEFGAVKARFRRESGSSQILCDRPDRLCALLPQEESGQVYAELLNVSGRVAMVMGTVDVPTPAAVAQIRKGVGEFVEELVAANAL